MSVLNLETPPKINLYLRVLGVREDGFHEIETIFLPLAAPLDKVSISPSENGQLKIIADHSDLPEEKENLCWQAATAFAALANCQPAWEIRIEKNIPVAAGLGGGSSDAGVVLRILFEQFPGLTEEQIRELAVGIGADVPFFLAPEPAVGRGIGEELLPLKLGQEINFILVNPLFPVDTAWAYRQWQSQSGSPAIDLLADALSTGDVEQLAVLLHNDLAPAVFRKFPLLQILQDAMLTSGILGVGLSGSGPTLFGVCADAESAVNAAKKMGEEFGESIWVLVTKTDAG